MKPIHQRRTLLTAAAVVAGLASAGLLPPILSAHADIAPPDSPPGVNLLPGAETTRVRMVAETVVLDVQPKSSQGGQGEARVQADFQMRNLGDSDEALEVRFPLTFWDGRSDGEGNYPEIRDVHVTVNGAPVQSRRIRAPAFSQSAEQEIPWLVFSVTFSPGKDVPIRVTYTADGTGDGDFVAFKYILETGAGWAGTIGSADLIVRLPYEANPLNVVFDHTGFSQTSPGGQFDGRDVRWHYDELEPTYESNLEISLVKPEVWLQVLQERERVQANPRDGEAWGRLGKLYKETGRFRRAYREDAGGQDLYDLAIDAYEQAVTLLPKDALWHIGFADLLFPHYLWHVYMSHNQDVSELVRAAEQASLAYALDSEDPRILDGIGEMAISIKGVVTETAGRYDFLILTATPAPGSDFFPKDYATPTPFASATAAPLAATPTLAPRQGRTSPTIPATEAPPAAGSSNPICGSSGMALALVLAIPLLGIVRRWIQSSG